MSTLIICEGDEVTFDLVFGERTVTLIGPALMTGTGVASISRRRTCVLGDEKRTQWPAQYFIPGYSPGTGMLSIESLDDSQVSNGVLGGEPLIRQGSRFVACFRPQVLAVLSSLPNTPDSPAPSMGSGTFKPTQSFVYTRG